MSDDRPKLTRASDLDDFHRELCKELQRDYKGLGKAFTSGTPFVFVPPPQEAPDHLSAAERKAHAARYETLYKTAFAYHHKLAADSDAMFANILTRLDHDMTLRVTEHKDYDAAFQQSDCSGLWTIVESVHTDTGLTLHLKKAKALEALRAMRQGHHNVEDYCREHAKQVLKLERLGYTEEQDQQVYSFLMSLNAEFDDYRERVFSLAEAAHPPATLPAARTAAIAWWRTREASAHLRAKDQQTRPPPGQTQEHANHAREHQQGHHGKHPGAAADKRPANPSPSGKSGTHCWWCERRGATWRMSGHDAKDCNELRRLSQPGKLSPPRGPRGDRDGHREPRRGRQERKRDPRDGAAPPARGAPPPPRAGSAGRSTPPREAAHQAITDDVEEYEYDFDFEQCSLAADVEADSIAPIEGPAPVLFDTGATTHLFRDERLLSEVHNIEPRCIFGITAAPLHCSRAGTFGAYGKVLLIPSLRTNLLSQFAARRTHTVSYDDASNTYTLTPKAGGPPDHFKGNMTARLYVQEPPASPADAPGPRRANSPEMAPAAQHHIYQATRTAAEADEPKQFFSPEHVTRAREALRLHAALDHPGDAQLSAALEHGRLLKTTLTPQDLRAARALFGPCPACLAGKTPHAPALPSTAPPPPAVGHTIHADLFWINAGGALAKLPYLITVEGLTGFVHVCRMDAKDGLAKALSAVIANYQSHGRAVRVLRSDSEAIFGSVERLINSLGVTLMRSAPGRHEHRAERYIRTIKDRFRSTLLSLPYTLPAFLYPHLLEHVASSMNLVPNASTGSNTPRELVTGVKTDVTVSLRAAFGDYGLFKVPLSRPALRDTQPRAVHGIVIGRDHNSAGSVRAFLLQEQQVVMRAQFAPLPIPDSVSTLITRMADAQPAVPLAEAIGYVPHIITATPGPTQDPAPQAPQAHGGTTPAAVPLPTGQMLHQPAEQQEPPHPHQRPPPGPLAPPTPAPPAPVPRAPPARPAVQPGPASTIPPHLRSPPNLLLTLRHSTPRAYHITVPQALKDRAQEADAAITAELSQMLALSVWAPVHADTLTAAEAKAALPSSMFLKEKKDAAGNFISLKARLVAGGHRQAPHMPVDTSAPTVHPDVLLLGIAIAAYERRSVATMDVKAAYLNAHLPATDTVHMKITGRVLATLLRIQPSYQAYARAGRPLYVRLLKALYGLKQSAALWYSHIAASLRSFGFNKSSHDQCLFTRPGQFLMLHVDDLIVFTSPASPPPAPDLRLALTRTYAGVTYHPGPSVSYLNVDVTMDPHGGATLRQPHYVDDLLHDFPGSATDKAATPAGENLFQDDGKSGAHPDPAEFLSWAMRLMYLAKRTRPDILLPVSYLASRAQTPTTHDWNKLRRVVAYLRSTPTLGLRFRPTSPHFHLWADASYATNPTAKSHTGALLAFPGCAPFVAISSKQQATTKSSTEAELVALNTAVDTAILARNILADLGHPQPPTPVYQDNKSTIQLAEAGASKRRRCKHVDVRLFFIKDKIADGTIALRHLPSDAMTADLLTKPLPRATFLRLRGLLLSGHS